MSALLEVKGLTKRFGGVTAVDACSFTVPEGSVTALVGPNGSGKTTAFNLITGYARADAGTVSFAGTVPTNGKTVTIETADGYSVTLTHLGSIALTKGATVAEQDVVGTIGPSGTPEVDEPYVHLGIRITADPLGYVDPLGLLPPASGGTHIST